jgi:hypothetical protein
VCNLRELDHLRERVIENNCERIALRIRGLFAVRLERVLVGPSPGYADVFSTYVNMKHFLCNHSGTFHCSSATPLCNAAMQWERVSDVKPLPQVPPALMNRASSAHNASSPPASASTRANHDAPDRPFPPPRSIYAINNSSVGGDMTEISRGSDQEGGPASGIYTLHTTFSTFDLLNTQDPARAPIAQRSYLGGLRTRTPSFTSTLNSNTDDEMIPLGPPVRNRLKGKRPSTVSVNSNTASRRSFGTSASSTACSTAYGSEASQRSTRSRGPLAISAPLDKEERKRSRAWKYACLVTPNARKRRDDFASEYYATVNKMQHNLALTSLLYSTAQEPKQQDAELNKGYLRHITLDRQLDLSQRDALLSSKWCERYASLVTFNGNDIRSGATLESIQSRLSREDAAHVLDYLRTKPGTPSADSLASQVVYGNLNGIEYQ